MVNVGKVGLEPLLPFLSSWKWKTVIQNAKFESKFVEHFYRTPINNGYDTFLAEQVLNPDSFGNGLEALALRYTGEQLDKKIRASFYSGTRNQGEFTQEQIAYAAKDVEILFPIMEAQRAKLTDNGLDAVASLEFQLAGVVAHMELVGVPVDVAKWRKKIVEYRERHEASRIRMNELLFDDNKMDEQMGLFVRDGINLNSTKQLIQAFHKLGIDVEKTDERVISLINHPAAQELLNYRALQKIISSYGASFLDKIHPFTGRIHADFQQLGTETGRFSCKDPNLQQMPEEFRECISAPDLVIVGADYSQIELRILAELSGDVNLISAFASGHDVHKATAALMFNVPIDNVSKEQRYLAKTINFGISYGMGLMKLMDTINQELTHNGRKAMSKNQVAAILNKYRSTYKGVRTWLQDAGEQAFKHGYSTTMYGRKRFYNRPDRTQLTDKEWDEQSAAIRRKGANSPIQGTNADITKLAMLNLHQDLRDYGYMADLVIQVHDEIVVLAHKRQAETVKLLVEESMMKSAQILLKNVPVKVDAYISDIWKKG